MSAPRRPAGVVRPGKLALAMLIVSALVLLITICTGSIGGVVVGGITLLASVVWVSSLTHRTRVLMAWVVGITNIVGLWMLIF